MMWEVGPATAEMKKKYLKDDKEYYYVWFLATRSDARGQGLCSALVRHYQATAAKAQLPIWLECSTERNKRLYQKLGFKVMEEITVGAGKAASDGTAEEGGPGCKMWGLLWRPEQ